MTIEQAAARARQAQAAWAGAGLARRLEVVVGAGARLIARRELLVGALAADGFSTDLAAYWGAWIEGACSARKLRADAHLLARACHTRSGAELVVRRPDGVVLLDPPASSAAINSSPLLSILLPGNAVLVRSSRSHAQAFLVGEVVGSLVEAGFDAHLVALVDGRSRDVCARLLPDRAVETVVFFGGAAAGEVLARDAFTYGVKLIAELGGSDHMAVWRDAELGPAVEAAHRAWHVSTQPCLVPKHLLVHGACFDAFLARLLAELPAHARTIEADHTHGRLVPVAQIDRFTAAFDELAAIGRVHAGGYRMRADGTRDDAGPYVAPTIVEVAAHAVAERRLLAFTEEIAFPLLPVVRFDGRDGDVLQQMTRVMEASPFGLRASVWTATQAVAIHFARTVAAVGILVINDDHARAPEVASSWGGPRRSGGPCGENYGYAERTSRAQSIVIGGDAFPGIAGALGIEEPS